MSMYNIAELQADLDNTLKVLQDQFKAKLNSLSPEQQAEVLEKIKYMETLKAEMTNTFNN